MSPEALTVLRYFLRIAVGISRNENDIIAFGGCANQISRSCLSQDNDHVLRKACFRAVLSRVALN